ncbi:MAG: hypothetical protein IIC03_09845 [Proteobacteria bacterium]|nr:hypothetical protein [Pseudomonadota bacterium]
MRCLALLAALALALAIAPLAALAGEADVIEVRASRSANGWRFDVTVAHGDTGWEHYADAWRVVGPDGAVLGARTLLHPHVGEQPFTRSLGGVAIPAWVTSVTVEAHDSGHGWGGAVVEVTLPR